jgi:hypothetical protein
LQPALTRPFSFAVKWVEIVGPLLVLSPWRNGAARMIAVGLFWALHLGLQTFQAIGVFQLVGLAAWLVCLPSAAWDWRGVRASAGRAGPNRADQPIPPDRWSERLALVPLVYLTILATCTITGVLVRGMHYPVPALIERVAIPLHLQEGWAMFSSTGPTRAWFLAPGRLADGAEIEVLRRAPLDWHKPADLQSAQRGFRWTLYLGNAIVRGIYELPHRATHSALLEYLCREWNSHAEPNHRLEHVELVMVAEAVPAPGLLEPPGDPYLLAQRDCARAP